MGKYMTTGAIKYGGKYYAVGEVVDLPDELAARLPVEADDTPDPDPEPEQPAEPSPPEPVEVAPKPARKKAAAKKPGKSKK